MSLQSNSANPRKSKFKSVPCPSCGTLYSSQGLTSHYRSCVGSPSRYITIHFQLFFCRTSSLMAQIKPKSLKNVLWLAIWTTVAIFLLQFLLGTNNLVIILKGIVDFCAKFLDFCLKFYHGTAELCFTLYSHFRVLLSVLFQLIFKPH